MEAKKMMSNFLKTTVGWLATVLLNFIDKMWFKYLLYKNNYDRSFLDADLRDFTPGKKRVKAVPVGRDDPDTSKESAIYRNIHSKDKLVETTFPGVYTMDKFFETCIEKFPQNVCFQYRNLLRIEKKQIEHGSVWQTFHYEDKITELTFAEVGEKIENYAKGIQAFCGIKETERFGIYDNTCPEWVLTSEACYRLNSTIVTVYSNLGEDNVAVALGETQIKGLLTNEELIPSFETLGPRIPTLKRVIYRKIAKEEGHDPKLIEDISKKTGISFISTEELEELGKSISGPLKSRRPTKDDLAMIMYTSGTTGAPKGCMILHRNIVSSVAGVGQGFDLCCVPWVYLGYLPLAHILEQISEHILFYKGGCIAFASSKTLTDTAAKPCGDLRAFQPTLFCGPPRVFETIKKAILGKMHDPKQTRPLVLWLFNTAVACKKQALKEGRDTPLWNALVFKKTKALFGGRNQFVMSGGASFNEDSQEFMRVVLCSTVPQGYGLTECCASLATHPMTAEFAVSSAGVPTTSAEVKLVSIPEMGYKTDDKPCPRGEIVTRGPAVTPGYFNNQKMTEESFVNGWFFTGDIGRINADGTISIVDRKKNLIKLDHGEYVAIESLESVYTNSPFVSPNGILVYGSHETSYLVAVVIPDMNYLIQWASKKGILKHSGDKITKEEKLLLLKDKSVTQAILDSLNKEADVNKLTKVERIVNCTCVLDEWTPENGCLTAAMKFNRKALNTRYETIMKQMYQK